MSRYKFDVNTTHPSALYTDTDSEDEPSIPVKQMKKKGRPPKSTRSPSGDKPPHRVARPADTPTLPIEIPKLRKQRGIIPEMKIIRKTARTSKKIVVGSDDDRDYEPTGSPLVGKVKSTKKVPKKTNPWITHLGAFRKKNPGLPFSECAREAKKTYTRNNAS